MKSAIFFLLRVFVVAEQSRFWRWLSGARPDVIVETMPRLDDDVPEVHAAPSVFIADGGRAAYMADGLTLRRVALDQTGTLVRIRKLSKLERKARKRVRQHGANRISAGA